VVKTLMMPKWWEAEDKFSSTTVSLVGSLSKGRIIYLRNVKSSVGPAKFRLRLWSTQWAEQDGEGACVICHGYDEFDQCHLLSKFFISADKDKPDSVCVRYEELTSSPKVAVKLARNKIKKSHLFVLEVLACQVAKNKLSQDPFPTITDLSSQRSTDAVNDLTSFSGGDDSFDNEADENMVLVDWQELPLDDVRLQLQSTTGGVRVGERSWRLRTYKNVFVGNEAVDWLVERYPVSRDSAVLLFRELQGQGWLRHVKSEHDFKDDHLFFCWTNPSESRRVDAEISAVDAPSALMTTAQNQAEEEGKKTEKKEAGETKPSVESVLVVERITNFENTIRKFKALSTEGQLLFGSIGFGMVCYIMNWTTLFLLCALLTSYLAWCIGQNSMESDLRKVNRQLKDLQDQLNQSLKSQGRLSGNVIEPDRDVEQLKQRHGDTIAKVREILGAEISSKEHDDLFILRYVLSFEKPDVCAEAIRKGLAWRLENAELIAMVDRGEEVACRDVIKQFAISDHHPKPLADGSPLLVTRAGLCDLSGLLNNVKSEDLVSWLMWLNEFGYRECDRVTRETGRLTKLIRVNDMNFAGLLQDRGFFSAIGKSSRVAAYCCNFSPLFSCFEIF
jgi:hypothetical protein